MTIPQDYVEALDRLVEEGLYIDRGAIIREALRDHFRQKGIEPFCNEGAEKNKPGMHVETEKIRDMLKETISLMNDFMQHLINVERRLEKIENQRS